MQLAKNLGVKKIFELGSGKVLTGIAKRMIEMFQQKVMKIQKILKIWFKF